MFNFENWLHKEKKNIEEYEKRDSEVRQKLELDMLKLKTLDCIDEKTEVEKKLIDTLFDETKTEGDILDLLIIYYLYASLVEEYISQATKIIEGGEENV